MMLLLKSFVVLLALALAFALALALALALARVPFLRWSSGHGDVRIHSGSRVSSQCRRIARHSSKADAFHDARSHTGRHATTDGL